MSNITDLIAHLIEARPDLTATEVDLLVAAARIVDEATATRRGQKDGNDRS